MELRLGRDYFSLGKTADRALGYLLAGCGVCGLHGDGGNPGVFCLITLLCRVFTSGGMPVVGIVGGPLTAEGVDMLLLGRLLRAGAQSEDQRQQKKQNN